MRRFFVGLLILISAVCLVASSTSLWTRRHVVNTEVFVAGAERVIAEPAVQARIETLVVTQTLANPDVQQAVDQAVAVLPPRLQAFRPSIEDGIGTVLGRGVHAILNSPQFDNLTSAALTTVQTQLINGQPVQFTLGQAKARVPPENQTGLAWQVLNFIPSDVGITILTPQQAPQVYTALDLLKSLWLWTGLVAFGLFAGALALSRRRLKTLRAWAVTTAVIGLLLVAAFALARGPILTSVKPVNADAAAAIYDGVTASLRSWTLWLVLIAVGIVVVTLLWGRVGIIPAIRRGWHAGRDRVARLRAERAAATEAGPGAPEPERAAESWPRRTAAATRAFVDGLNLPERLGALAAFLRRNLREARWIGVAIGAIVLLLWPSPTLSVLIWVAALVALYIGVIELVLTVATPAPVVAAGEPAELSEATVAGGNRAAAPAATTALPPQAAAAAPPLLTAPAPPPTAAAVLDAPGGAATAPPRRPRPTAEEISAMGTRIDLLMRLNDAHTAGALTDEEFAREKAQLLEP